MTISEKIGYLDMYVRKMWPTYRDYENGANMWLIRAFLCGHLENIKLITPKGRKRLESLISARTVVKGRVEALNSEVLLFINLVYKILKRHEIQKNTTEKS